MQPVVNVVDSHIYFIVKGFIELIRINLRFHLPSYRFWDHEVKTATKELQKPKLTRVLIKCYGRSYALAGLFVFSLVCFSCRELLLCNLIVFSFDVLQ